MGYLYHGYVSHNQRVNPINPTCMATLGVLLPHAPLVPRGPNQLKGLQRQNGFDRKILQ